MLDFTCKNCTAVGLKLKGSFLVCEYCGSKFLLTADDFASQRSKAMPTAKAGISHSFSSEISLGGDIELLLQKCRLDPRNARKYANLILDIDPTNKEAYKYL